MNDLEGQIKQLQFKADLHLSIGKDITKRRAHTLKSKMTDYATQTDNEPVSNPEEAPEVENS